MKTLTKIFAIAFAFATTSRALATNGDDLIAIGPNARAMGGTGIATPQDAISAVFANPAAMCFTPGCAYSEVNFVRRVIGFLSARPDSQQVRCAAQRRN